MLRVAPGRRIDILIALGYLSDDRVREKRYKQLHRICNYNRNNG